MKAIIDTVVSWFTALLSFFTRVFEWIGGVFVDFMEFILDIPLTVLKGMLDGILYLLEMIPVPDFMTDYSLQTVFGLLPDSVLYFVQFFGIPQALALIGSGVAFNLLRKVVTLGQW